MTRLIRTFAAFAALTLVSAPAMAQGFNPFAFGSVWVGPYQNQYPVYGYSNYGYSNYGYSNYGYSNRYSNYNYSNYGRRGRSTYVQGTVNVPSGGGSISVPSYGGNITVQPVNVPGLQNVITLPPGYTVQGSY